MALRGGMAPPEAAGFGLFFFLGEEQIQTHGPHELFVSTLLFFVLAFWQLKSDVMVTRRKGTSKKAEASAAVRFPY